MTSKNMDEEVDIYGDLPSFNTNESEEFKALNKKCQDMEVEMSSLRDQLSNLEAMNRKIRRNFSSLLKTARAEIARKDKSIADLRTELEDLKFKRRWRANKVFVDTRVPPPNFVPIAPSVQPLSFELPLPLDSEFEEEVKQNYQETVYGARLKKRLMDEKYKEEVNKENSVSQVITESTLKKDDQPKNSTQHNLRNRNEIKRPPRNDELTSYGFEGHKNKYDKPRIGPRTPSPKHHHSRERSRNRLRSTDATRHIHRDPRRDQPRDNKVPQDRRSKSLSRSRLHQGASQNKRKRLYSVIDETGRKKLRTEEEESKVGKIRGIKRKSSQEVASPKRTGLRKTTELQRNVYKSPYKSSIDDSQTVHSRENGDKGHEAINTKKSVDEKQEVINSKKNLLVNSVDKKQEVLITKEKIDDKQLFNNKKNVDEKQRYVIPKKSLSRKSVEEKQEVNNSKKSLQQNLTDPNQEVINIKKNLDEKQEVVNGEKNIDKKQKIMNSEIKFDKRQEVVNTKKTFPQKLLDIKREIVNIESNADKKPNVFDSKSSPQNLTEKKQEIIISERNDDKKPEVINSKSNFPQNLVDNKQEIINSERNVDKKQGLITSVKNLTQNVVGKNQEFVNVKKIFDKKQEVNNKKNVDKKHEAGSKKNLLLNSIDEKQEIINAKKIVDEKQDIHNSKKNVDNQNLSQNIDQMREEINVKKNVGEKQNFVYSKKNVIKKLEVIDTKKDVDNKQEVVNIKKNVDENQEIGNQIKNFAGKMADDEQEVIDVKKTSRKILVDEKQEYINVKENLTKNLTQNLINHKQTVIIKNISQKNSIDEKQNVINIKENKKENLVNHENSAHNLVVGKQEVINILNSSGDSPTLESGSTLGLGTLETKVNPLEEQLSNDVTYMILESHISRLFSGIQPDNVVESVNCALTQEIKAEMKVEENSSLVDNNDLEDGEIPDSEDESLDKKLQTHISKEKTFAEAIKTQPSDKKNASKLFKTHITQTSPSKRHNNHRKDKSETSASEDRRRKGHRSKSSHHYERRRSRESPSRSKQVDKYRSCRDDTVKKHTIPNLLSDAKENQTLNGFHKLQGEILTVQGSKVLKEPTITKIEPNKTENSGMNRSRAVVARRSSKDSKNDQSKNADVDPKENLTKSPNKPKLQNGDIPAKELEKSTVDQKVPHNELFLCNKKALVINPESFTNPVKENFAEINKELVRLRRAETEEKPTSFENDLNQPPIDSVNLLGKGITISKKPTEPIVNKAIVKHGEKIIIPRRRRPVVLSDSPPVVVVNCNTKI